jgi:hypothetical protein
MTLPLVPVLLAGGGVVYVAAQAADPAPKAGPPRQLAPNTGATIAQASNLPAPGGGMMGVQMVRSGTMMGIQYSPAFTANPMLIQSAFLPPVDNEFQQKVDLLEKYMEKNYNDMTAVAKSEALAVLNAELKLDPPLKSSDDWATIARVSGGAAAAAGCAATGLGTTIAPLCAMAGAWLGAKFHDLIAKNYDELKDYCSDKWGAITGFAHDVYDEIAGLWPF